MSCVIPAKRVNTKMFLVELNVNLVEKDSFPSQLEVHDVFHARMVDSAASLGVRHVSLAQLEHRLTVWEHKTVHFVQEVLSRPAKVLMFVNSVKKDGSKITLGKQPARNVLRDFFALGQMRIQCIVMPRRFVPLAAGNPWRSVKDCTREIVKLR